jgi:3-phenylpropionate/trans-cinnamate dioxygenase ferredoxin subunit
VTLERALAAAELTSGQLRRVDIAGRALCLARTQEGDVFAVDDTCTHEEESLSEGELVGCEVECPWHFSRFDIRTGEAAALPAIEPLRTYRVVVKDGDIFVELPPWAEE